MSPDLGRVGSDFGRARGHSITWRRRRGKRARMAITPESSVLGDSTHERISPDDLMLKKTELKDECCVVVTSRSSRNTETQLRWR